MERVYDSHCIRCDKTTTYRTYTVEQKNIPAAFPYEANKTVTVTCCQMCAKTTREFDSHCIRCDKTTTHRTDLAPRRTFRPNATHCTDCDALVAV